MHYSIYTPSDSLIGSGQGSVCREGLHRVQLAAWARDFNDGGETSERTFVLNTSQRSLLADPNTFILIFLGFRWRP